MQMKKKTKIDQENQMSEKHLTTEEKLNQALGINSIDDVLNGLNVEEPDNKLKQLNEEMTVVADGAIKEIDQQIAEYKAGNSISMKKLEDNLAEITNLVDVCKSVISKLYDNITSTDYVDPEVIQATASLIKSTQESISVYADLYKTRKEFYNRVALEMLRHNNNLDLARRRHEFKMLELGMFKKEDENEQVVRDEVQYSQEQIMKALSEMQNSGQI